MAAPAHAHNPQLVAAAATAGLGSAFGMVATLSVSGWGRIVATIGTLATVAAGVLTVRLTAERAGSPGAQGRDWAGQVGRSTTDTAVAAEVSAAHTKALAASAARVASSVDSVAAAVEEFGASAREIAASTSGAARIADEAVAFADESRAIVERLASSSHEIEAVADLIASVADETNLLALNATIEAARAGEAGRGFAVVASEVKNLASETAKATQDIRAKVDAIRADSTAASSAIARIAAVIDRMRDLQTTIAGAVEEQTATTGEIAHAVHDAARGTTDIASEVDTVAAKAYETTLGASATRAVALELVAATAAFTGSPATPPAEADPVRAAIAAHSQWKARLTGAIVAGTSDIDVPTAGRDDACAFGKWLYGDAAAKGSPSYEEVRGLHARFHREAADVLAEALAGRQAQARAAMAPGSPFGETSAELTLALTRWH